MIQNAAARIVTSRRKFDLITPIPYGLHWLPVEKRIEFKVSLMTYKILNGLAPSYLIDLIKFYKIYTPRRSLRSVEKGLLDVSHTRKTNEGTVY